MNIEHLNQITPDLVESIVKDIEQARGDDEAANIVYIHKELIIAALHAALRLKKELAVGVRSDQD